MEFNSYYFELSFIFFLLSNISFELQPARVLFTPHTQQNSTQSASETSMSMSVIPVYCYIPFS